MLVSTQFDFPNQSLVYQWKGQDFTDNVQLQNGSLVVGGCGYYPTKIYIKGLFLVIFEPELGEIKILNTRISRLTVG